MELRRFVCGETRARHKGDRTRCGIAGTILLALGYTVAMWGPPLIWVFSDLRLWFSENWWRTLLALACAPGALIFRDDATVLGVSIACAIVEAIALVICTAIARAALNWIRGAMLAAILAESLSSVLWYWFLRAGAA